MQRRAFLQALGTFFAYGFLGRLLRPLTAEAAHRREVQRVAFGSCAYQTEPQPIWDGVLATKPDVFVFLGDNIYADTDDMQKMRKDYELLSAVPGLRKLRQSAHVIATWDDHDYGQNDGGADYPRKKESKELMLDFFGEPRDSDRRRREGIYTSYFYGEAPNRLQVILLDLRTFRTALKPRGGAGAWGYEPNAEAGASLLGAAQWAWLEDQLRQPADFRILGSSVQLASSEHEWEKWANFPRERERLLTLLDRLRLRNFVVISGDMHFAELSKDATPSGTPFYDLTASGLNVVEEVSVVNSKRVHAKDNFAHFGLVQLHWGAKEIQVSLEIRDQASRLAFAEKLRFPR